MLISIAIILIGLSNCALVYCIIKINKHIHRHETYILELCNMLTEIFCKEDDDYEYEYEYE